MDGKKQEKLSTNKLVIAGVLSILSLIILFALNSSGTIITNLLIVVRELPLSWAFGWILEFMVVPRLLQSPMFYALPFFGFFALFFIVDWVNKEFDTKLALNPAFPALFFFISLAAYYLALYWYVSNFVELQGLQMSLDMVGFWGKLQASAFILFVWGGLFGWIARYVVERLNI